MPTVRSPRPLPAAAAVFGAAPAAHPVADARARIRAANAAAGRRIAVLDDDPTGSQSVHRVAVVTVLDPAEYAAGLAEPGSTCFVLTNTRSLSEADAVRLNRDAGRALLELAERLGGPVELVSRSDSTLRGHVIAEVGALDAARRDVTGRGYDGVLLVPAFIEAGRVTAGDVHWARAGGEWLPAGETEFARDASFGYAASDLKDFVAEKSGGAIAPGDVRSIGLDDIRAGGPERVAAILRGVTDGGFVVVNAMEYGDLEIVVLGVQDAARSGRAFLYRSGPSFVRALAGLEPRDPLRPDDIWPAGRPGGHGLVVVGSHVGLTSRQLAVARSRGDLAEIELDVATIADPARRAAHVADVCARAGSALARSDVVVFTSRALVRGADAAESLRISRAVSAAVVDVVAGLRAARPAWVVAKGGITSHDVAARGLGIRRAEVLGQMRPGIVSVFRPVEAAPEAIGVPYVVFPGNVGDETTLAYVIDVLRGDA
ncbi:MAG TPA: four-carbon acid sugar kinase family protein [Solirubrobacteraceae bacterium]|nr:four-carbon acid sugar kinase family protein [Solirubrobacteraceae bacterium]